jgi:hypothetical protein
MPSLSFKKLLGFHNGLFAEIVAISIGILFFIILEIFTIPMFDDVDIARQLGSVFAFLDGHGFVFLLSNNLSDLSQHNILPQVQFPHAYAFFAAGVYTITQDIVLANILLKLLFVAIFYVALLLLIRQMHPHLGMMTRIAIILFFTFVADPFRKPTEVMALTLLYLGLVFWLKGLKSERKLYWMFITGIALGFAAATRYVYVFYIVVIPFMAFLMFVRYKNATYIVQSLVVLLPALFLSASSTLYNAYNLSSNDIDRSELVVRSGYWPSGEVLRTDMIDGGIFWDNLLLAHPVGTSATGILPGLNYISSNFLTLNTSVILWLYSIIIISIALWTTYVSVTQFLQTDDKTQEVPDATILIVVFGFLVFGITMAVLIALSLVNGPVRSQGIWRTFVSNERYYVPVAVWIVIILSLFINNYADARSRLNKWVRRVIYVSFGIIAPVILLSTLLTFVNFRFRVAPLQPSFTEEHYATLANPIYGVLREVSQDEPVVFIYGSVFDPKKFEWITVLSGNVIYIGDLTPDTIIGASEPVQVLVAIPQNYPDGSEERILLERIVTEYDGEFVRMVDEYLAFYLVTVDSTCCVE